MHTNPGDQIEVLTKDDHFKGILMPSKDDTLVLKLKSGYNIGIKREKIRQIKLIQEKQEKKENPPKLTKKKGLKSITILHTGGTVASKIDYETGAVSSKFTPEEIIDMYPSLKEIANIDSKLISNIFSEDMRFAHYNLIAKAIELEIKKGTNGIIITHGTDTMHYTSAALSFILEDLPIPVILVGAQRSSDRGSSDGKQNLEAACHFISKTNFSEVAICMHETTEDTSCIILPGLKSKKMHSSRRDAFKPINDTPIARIINSKVQLLKPLKKPGKKLNINPIKEGLKIGILKVHPNLMAEELRTYNKFDGLIIEGTGIAGNLPINSFDKITEYNQKILNELKRLTAKMPVVATTQTTYGRINMNVYSTGRLLQEAGVIGNLLDVTTETAFMKLAWLLSNDPENVKEKFHEDLRGEFNQRILE